MGCGLKVERDEGTLLEKTPFGEPLLWGGMGQALDEDAKVLDGARGMLAVGGLESLWGQCLSGPE